MRTSQEISIKICISTVLLKQKKKKASLNFTSFLLLSMNDFLFNKIILEQNLY